MLESIKEAARGYKEGSEGRSLWRDLALLIFGLVGLANLVGALMKHLSG